MFFDGHEFDIVECTTVGLQVDSTYKLITVASSTHLVGHTSITILRCAINLVVKLETEKKKKDTLILTRRVGETIIVGDDINPTVLGVKGNQVPLGINAPMPRAHGCAGAAHTLFLNGLYVERPDVSVQFRWVKAPTSVELTDLAHRIAQHLGRSWNGGGCWRSSPTTAWMQ